MHQKLHHIINRLKGATICFVFLCGATLLAHGNFIHVIGTVVSLHGDVLVVKTAKGDVSVKLGDKTEYTRNAHAVKKDDLVPGIRVVVDLPSEGKSKVAHSVKLGAVVTPSAP